MSKILKIQFEGTDNTGHGHVYKRPDGSRMRCGGPGRCDDCSVDQARALKELVKPITIDLAGAMDKITPEMMDSTRDKLIEILTLRCSELLAEKDEAVEVALRHGALSVPCDCVMCDEVAAHERIMGYGRIINE